MKDQRLPVSAPGRRHGAVCAARRTAATCANPMGGLSGLYRTAPPVSGCWLTRLRANPGFSAGGHRIRLPGLAPAPVRRHPQRAFSRLALALAAERGALRLADLAGIRDAVLIAEAADSLARHAEGVGHVGDELTVTEHCLGRLVDLGVELAPPGGELAELLDSVAVRHALNDATGFGQFLLTWQQKLAKLCCMSNAAETPRCLDCRRPIRSAESLATGRGAGCRAKIRKAARQADLSAWTPQQVEDARQAIEDGAVIPSTRKGVFHVVSSDGTEVHLVHRAGCNCTSGLKTLPTRPCFHRCAIAIVLASQAPAAEVTAPAQVAVPMAAPRDIWAELDRLTEAFMAVG